MRDAIVFSGWSWETFNFPERISLALAHLGCRVLYCEGPLSVLRSKPRPLREVAPGIHALRLRFLSSRFNYLPGAPLAQAYVLQKQIERAAGELRLHDPIFLYVYMGKFIPLCKLMKRDHFIVHICMDHPLDAGYDRLVQVSDKTLALPRSAYHKFRAKFGAKVETVPHCVHLRWAPEVAGRHPDPLSGIPRPRLGYTGSANGRLNGAALHALLHSHPEWHFVSLGSGNALSLPNAHALPWMAPEALGAFVRSLDVGFMPYDCYSEAWLHCVPTKVFEYFAVGLPVVSTPMIQLWQYKDLVYFGDTAEDLADAIEEALREPPESPKRAARIEIARSHSLENLATALRQRLPLGDLFPADAAHPVRVPATHVRCEA
jgi:glycosyltransferase involved in cell wall biosynthesis